MTEGLARIDGSYGEAGGQVLRTSLTLSAITARPLEIINIRAGRKSPGLKPQHIISARATSEVTSGELIGAQLDSQTLRFTPGRIGCGAYVFDVASVKASAGATGLIIQTITPVLSFAGGVSNITIRGGTHVPWSPPLDYLKGVFLPEVTKMGISTDLAIKRWGFYPVGGGEVEMQIRPCARPLKGIEVRERGKLQKLFIMSVVANLPLSIAERQRERALKRFQISNFKFQIDTEVKEVSSPGRGTSLFILAEFENIRAGFSALGAIGKPAEKVADEAVDEFLSYWHRKGALDPHLTDQLILYAALAEGSSVLTTSRVTNHLLTNIYVIGQFLPVRFQVKGGPGEEGEVTVEGVGF
ncbi:MAG: RNA 3'-phosphate cyclase [Deltaproteobacteria bacterium]|nr:RNA 3'-phosphate cyclase [Deltaproteobacteria bacterium]